MSRPRFRISTSLDGYAAGSRQSVNHPLGVGDELHGPAPVRTVAAARVTHLELAR